jgi:antitoxin component YwqK of YwqJK toxin-antitoxin module
VIKKIVSILIVLLVFIASSYSQTEERAPNGPRSVRNKRDELRRRQDVWRTYNSYGDLISEIEYKNDKREGKSIIYYPGGGEKGEKVREECQYFDGKLDGPYTRKYISGQVAIEGNYELKQRVGLWTSYYEDGQVKYEGSYDKGRKVGVWKVYNRKGVLAKSVDYSAPPIPKPSPAKKETPNAKPGGHAPIKKQQ